MVLAGDGRRLGALAQVESIVKGALAIGLGGISHGPRMFL